MGKAIATGLGAGMPASMASGGLSSNTGQYRGSKIPAKMAGLALEDLLADYRHRLFDRYLPFWEKEGYDTEHGGFMCYLHEDGSIQSDQKDIWYQGRGIWVYSFLYNNIDRNPKWLKMAKKSRDFMVAHMHYGDGTWATTVNRVGKAVDGMGQSSPENIYGSMFAACGLIQHAKATGSEEDLDLAKLCIRKSVELYENPDYRGVSVTGVDRTGLRTQGHSFIMVWTVSQLLEINREPGLEELVGEHLDLIANKFWNDDYGISNENLFHDYSRIPSLANQMMPGHSIETQWMAMAEAMRVKNIPLAQLFQKRFRRLIEMCWDYVFDGIGSTDYHVFATAEHPAGPVFDIKSMWSQTEALIGCMMVLEYSGEVWAREWYERIRAFLLRSMTTDFGVWRQAVDRFGVDKKRAGISIYRRGNFHQPRCLMMNILSLERIIANKGAPVSLG